MFGLDGRVERLEGELTPGACVRVTTWFDACESRAQALARLGTAGPDDLLILLADWSDCPRVGRHRHTDAEVLVYPVLGDKLAGGQGHP